MGCAAITVVALVALHPFASHANTRPLVSAPWFSTALTAPDSAAYAGGGPGLVDDTARGSVDLGVSVPALTENAARSWRPADLQGVSDFERDARKHAAIVMWYADFAHTRFDISQLRAVAARGSVPEITWEPWDAITGYVQPLVNEGAQPQYSLANIIAGRYDSYIASWARGIRDYGGLVRLRFAQEMNGSSYSWDEVLNGNHRGEYVAAWRHVHGVFADVGASNVLWIWCPLTGDIHADQYPGDDQVDILGVDGYNAGSRIPAWGGWRSFGDVFSTSIAALRAIAPGKPIAISETASSEAGGDKAAWIQDFFEHVDAIPAVASVTWANTVNQVDDWPIDSSPASRSAFATAVASPRYR